jgi:hypothetical protein
MPTTPRTHEPDVHKTHVPSAAAGDQLLDEDEDRRTTVEDLGDPKKVKVAPDAATTASGRDVGRETGELYGQGIAPAGDVDEDGVRGPQDYDEAGGETFNEALRISATEHGTAGEAPVDDVRGTDADDERLEDEDVPPADLGAAGPGGL